MLQTNYFKHCQSMNNVYLCSNYLDLRFLELKKIGSEQRSHGNE